jgi:hypothetical protein
MERKSQNDKEWYDKKNEKKPGRCEDKPAKL